MPTRFGGDPPMISSDF